MGNFGGNSELKFWDVCPSKVASIGRGLCSLPSGFFKHGRLQNPFGAGNSRPCLMTPPEGNIPEKNIPISQ